MTLYPKLFYDTKFESATHPTFKQEYPQYQWEIIQPYINPPDDSPPNIIALIQEFDVFITKAFLDNYPDIKIPQSLKQLRPKFQICCSYHYSKYFVYVLRFCAGINITI